MQTFFVHVSPSGRSLTIVDQKRLRVGYIVRASSATAAFDLIDAYQSGMQWAVDAALRGDIEVKRSTRRDHP